MYHHAVAKLIINDFIFFPICCRLPPSVVPAGGGAAGLPGPVPGRDGGAGGRPEEAQRHPGAPAVLLSGRGPEPPGAAQGKG